MSPNYTLIYWPGIPGRGEFIRVVLEYTRTPYKQIMDVDKVTEFLSPRGQHFAVPVLDIDGSTISQTPAILTYLAPKIGLGSVDEIEQARIMQLTLTALDLVNEAHDSHHPISVAEYFEDQKDAALRRAAYFRESRIPKFLTHYQTVLATNESGVLIGSQVSTADLSLFQALDGLEFAFPRRMAALRKEGNHKKVFVLKDKLGKELEGYLKSERRHQYSMGAFRHYPELDGE